MARPRKYRTQQERRMANNASAQRYRNRYHICYLYPSFPWKADKNGRNCDELKARRQEKAAIAREQQTAELKEKQALDLRKERKKLERESRDQERLRARVEEEKHRTFIKQAMGDAERISEDYNEFVGDRKAYVDGLYHEYVNSGLNGAPRAPAWFTLSIRPLEVMDRELRQLMDCVYRKVGPVSNLLVNGLALRRYITRFSRQCCGSMI
ncbi:hypothetical protein AAF712_016101 [Marasmius tenuissimus]|uniref:Uncharacterized protein n=1 Tax=Marasmius tenuissimus TaxID=585030 RepID=A0ABR2Z8F5_9AGAR